MTRVASTVPEPQRGSVDAGPGGAQYASRRGEASQLLRREVHSGTEENSATPYDARHAQPDALDVGRITSRSDRIRNGEQATLVADRLDDTDQSGSDGVIGRAFPSMIS